MIQTGMDRNQLLEKNRHAFDDHYSKPGSNLQFPNEYLIRCYHNYIKKHISPGSRILDFGYGSGNNSLYFIKQGYEVFGIEVVESTIEMIQENLRLNSLDSALSDNFKVVKPDWNELPFENGFFDFILANMVLYYYPSEKHIRKICSKLSNTLRPGGIVFFTMCGAKNSIMENAKQIEETNVYMVGGAGKRASLDGQFLYIIHDQDQLSGLFSEFELITAGYSDEKLFDRRDFTWIFIGKKPVSN